MVRENINPNGEPAILDRSILDYRQDFGTAKGKFIRLGELVIVSPFGSLSLSYHRTLLQWAQKQGAPSSIVGFVRRPADSGLFLIGDPEVEPHDVPTDLSLPSDWQESGVVVVHGNSNEYGRSQADGRKLTTQLFQAAVADEALVVGS